MVFFKTHYEQYVSTFELNSARIMSKCAKFDMKREKHITPFQSTVKHLQSGPHRDLKQCQFLRGIRYIEVLAKFAYFASKTCSWVLGYNIINPKCIKRRVRREERAMMSLFVVTQLLLLLKTRIQLQNNNKTINNNNKCTLF